MEASDFTVVWFTPWFTRLEMMAEERRVAAKVIVNIYL